jgi:hypothetical protein
MNECDIPSLLTSPSLRPSLPLRPRQSKCHYHYALNSPCPVHAIKQKMTKLLVIDNSIFPNNPPLEMRFNVP